MPKYPKVKKRNGLTVFCHANYIRAASARNGRLARSEPALAAFPKSVLRGRYRGRFGYVRTGHSLS